MAARGSAIPASGSFNSSAAGIDFYQKNRPKSLQLPHPSLISPPNYGKNSMA
jgi:hypothetical protein